MSLEDKINDQFLVLIDIQKLHLIFISPPSESKPAGRHLCTFKEENEQLRGTKTQFSTSIRKVILTKISEHWNSPLDIFADVEPNKKFKIHNCCVTSRNTITEAC